MATNTGNLGLKKPASSDQFSVEDANGNMEILDAIVGGALTTLRLNVDASGIFTEIQYKRQDGTLYKKSVLSGGTTPKYTTRTVTFYAANGTTVTATKVYTLSYTGDNLTSEVIS